MLGFAKLRRCAIRVLGLRSSDWEKEDGILGSLEV